MLKRFPVTKLRLLTLAIIASLVLQAPTYYFPLIFKNGPPPLFSTSYYIQNGDPALMYDLGCKQGKIDLAAPGRQDSLVILDFAQMWKQNNVYGVLGFSDPYFNYDWHFLSFADLKTSVKKFAEGYWVCTGIDKTSHLTLGVGTNNYGFFNDSNRTQQNMRNLAEDFGRNWANMINDLNLWRVQQGYSNQILFTGAIDIEWSGNKNADGIFLWQSAYVVSGWVNGFDSADNGTSVYFNYGACVGCYDYPNSNWYYASPDYWTMPDIYFVSWGAQPAYSIPEIYRNDGFLARQWAAVSKYGSLQPNGSRIIFSGAMTQMQACQQRRASDPTCDTLDNTPAEGWGQLVDAVNADTFTEQPLPQYSTDIKWQFK